MLQAAQNGEFDVLYLHSLSRLARESVITMPMLKRLVYVDKVRVISVTEGLDSDREGWDMIATFLAIQHERFIKELGAAVLRGQEGALLAGFSIGDYCLGFASEPVPGTEQLRRGRNARPRKVYVVQLEAAKWVVRIFHWFVYERRSPSWIARELNRLQAPKDHRATTKYWTHRLVVDLLGRLKYIGLWPWGENKNVRNPLTGQITREERSEEEAKKWRRHFPHLQIIDDETFELAQELLQKNRDKWNASRKEKGMLQGSRPGDAADNPRHLLSCLIQCASCGSNFYVGGSRGRYMFCPGHRRGTCECATKLRRDRAERLILEAIGGRVLQDPAWHQAVLKSTQAAWQAQQRDLPGELQNAETALVELDRKIGRLIDHLEDGPTDLEIKDRLAERRAERQKLLKEIERLRRSTDRALPAPTEAWIAKQVTELGAVLSNGGPAAALALRELVGGKIVVQQVQLPGRKRHYLQARFSITCSSFQSAMTEDQPNPECNSESAVAYATEEIVIDLIDPNPSDALAEDVKRLYDQGLMCKEIAKQMGIWPSQVTKLLKHWCRLHDQSLPDARVRRASLPRKTMEVHQYERVADDAVGLMRHGYSDARIGKKLGCSAFVAGKAIRHWHRIRSLPTPTTRQRREALARRAQQLMATQARMEDIAAKLECSMPTLRRLLDIAYCLDGQSRPDGRSRPSSPANEENNGGATAVPA